MSPGIEGLDAVALVMKRPAAMELEWRILEAGDVGA